MEDARRLDAPGAYFDLPRPSNQSVRPLEHLVRRIEELPAPGEVIGLPEPSRFDTSLRSEAKRWTIDYVFLGPSGVEDPGTNVTMNQIGLDYRLTRPFFQTEAFLTFRPGAEILFLAGPGGAAPNLPEQLYKVAFDLQLDFPVGEVMGVSLGITPGLWTDFIVTTSEDFRLPARALLTFRGAENLFVAVGVIYTDNIRRNILPGIGVIWDPNDRWHLEILYPRSRLVYRTGYDWNLYFVFERGGTTYNIRTLGLDEDFEYRDLRTMLGAEINRWAAFDLFVEVGGAFDRKFRHDIQGEFDLGPSFLLRVGTRF